MDHHEGQIVFDALPLVFSEALQPDGAVDGLDAIYIGPNDLAISLGCPPSAEPVEPVVIEAVATILAAAQRNGVVAGIHCPSGASARDKIEKGFLFTTIANDARLLAAGAKTEIAAARGG